MKRGLFLGRFQPFHNGHLEIIKRAKKEVDELIIVIGSAQYSRTKENPFTDFERSDMIEKTLDALGMTDFSIITIEDINDDEKYVAHIESQVPQFQVVYAATNVNTKELFEKAGYEARTSDRIGNIMSTEIRRKMLHNENWQHLVPKEVSEVIDDINGVERVKKIFSKG